VVSPAVKGEYGSKGRRDKYWARLAAGFHHVTTRSRLAGILKLTNRLFL
jgi:hypothetical protein